MRLCTPLSSSLGRYGRGFCEPGQTSGLPNSIQNLGFYECVVMFEAEKTINQCVEGLCSQVNGFIAGLQAGQEFPEVAGLNTQERQQVLDELVSVMAAYEGRCGY